jgi:hypothetical protein
LIFAGASSRIAELFHAAEVGSSRANEKDAAATFGRWISGTPQARAADLRPRPQKQRCSRAITAPLDLLDFAQHVSRLSPASEMDLFRPFAK